MNAILVNGLSAKSGGGKSILTNFLNSISKKTNIYQYVVIVPFNMGYEKYNKDDIIIIPFSDQRFSIIKQLYFYFYDVKRIIKTYNISLIFNLADVIIPVQTTQLFLFDWPYAVYPESLVWKKMGLFELSYRKLKLELFRKYIYYPLKIYTQTDSVKNRMISLYGLKNLSIIPNAVSLENIDGGIYKDFELPSKRYNFLCLCKYYIHKNLEIFIPVAKLIKHHELPFSIILTIEESQHPRAQNLLNKIRREGLENIIVNVGEVEMENVPALYKQSNALLLPTLLESFSGTYVEAMFHKKPIFTTNMDFARDVCGDTAIYFDPINPSSIFESLKKILDNSIINNIVANASLRLTNFLSWEEVSNKMLEEINENL